MVLQSSDIDRPAYAAGRFTQVAVLYQGQGGLENHQDLAEALVIPLLDSADKMLASNQNLFLTWRNGHLNLLDRDTLSSGGLSVDFDVRSQGQCSWPAAKNGPLAQAIGRKTRTVVDATAGWGQDSFLIFRMGYQVQCIERSRVMAELLKDGFERLSSQDWMRHLGLQAPRLHVGNAIEKLLEPGLQADCIYLDPMFPPKRKKSALTKKSMLILRELLGDDPDKKELFAAAMTAAEKRVVVKRPDHAEPLMEKADHSFNGKLVRYDVYLK